jgi:hypothetical protein
MLNIDKVLKDPRLMAALTGSALQEFYELLPKFEEEWIKKKKEEHEKKCKMRKWGGGSKGFLPTIERKLFFILFYYKCYPTYDLASVIFDCDRSQACRRQFDLTKALERTLGRKAVLPQRQMKSLEDFFRAFPEAKEVFIDGTERPIQRPKSEKRQKDNYSGKKKRHTRKNLIISDKEKWIGFLSDTANGKEHDFTIIKLHAPPDNMPKDIVKHLDLAFKGFAEQFPGHSVSMPEKKPRTKELDPAIKEQNKQKSSVRVLAEHALGGVKRLRIVSDVFRGRKKDFDDTVMLISCGLWNYHLTARR